MNKREKKLIEYLNWALEMIDNNFKETGKIDIAEVIVYKAAKNFVKTLKEEEEKED